MANDSKSRIQQLEKEGWVKQFVANEPRLSEAVDLYRESGFEVHLEPLPKGQACDTCPGTETPQEQGQCRVCFEGFEDQYRIIFTRPGKEIRRSDDEPF